MSDTAAPEAPRKRRRRRPSPSDVVLKTLREQASRLDRLGALVEDAVSKSMATAIEAERTEDVTKLTAATGQFIQQAGAGMGNMATALDKVSKATPTDPDHDDKPASKDDIMALLGGGPKRNKR